MLLYNDTGRSYCLLLLCQSNIVPWQNLQDQIPFPTQPFCDFFILWPLNRRKICLFDFCYCLGNFKIMSIDAEICFGSLIISNYKATNESTFLQSFKILKNEAKKQFGSFFFWERHSNLVLVVYLTPNFNFNYDLRKFLVFVWKNILHIEKYQSGIFLNYV